MRVKIDWLSFTVQVRAGVENQVGFTLAVEHGFFDMFGKEIVDKCFGGKWEERKGGRAPYSNSYDLATKGITTFLNPKVGNVLVEISGQGCENIRLLGVERDILEKSQNRLTRLDLACDIETHVMPAHFAPRDQYATTKTYSEMNSKSGQTIYLGSKESERYTRVYRYSKPHPRAPLLRIEFVFRRKVARLVAAQIILQGEMAVASVYGRKENFHHPVWQIDASGNDFWTYSLPERDAGKCVYWLITQAAPAFRRMVLEGAIKDPDLFIQTYLLNVP